MSNIWLPYVTPSPTASMLCDGQNLNHGIISDDPANIPNRPWVPNGHVACPTPEDCYFCFRCNFPTSRAAIIFTDPVTGNDVCWAKMDPGYV